MAIDVPLIQMGNVPELGDGWRILIKPLTCPMWPGWEGPEEVPARYLWNGHSSGILSPLFPRWNHPIASCRHDWRCKNARNRKERKWADREYRRDVGATSWWITAQIGYIGVRIGAFLGIGNEF